MSAHSTHAEIRRFALSLPEAWSDTPWEDDEVVKVRKKIFAFLGGPESTTLTVKLREAHGHAMSIDGAKPAGYGLGRSGWVVVPVDADGVDADLLRDWVEESYRTVAPVTLVRELDA
ncbi:MAG TPA: MmcQ/YjbR family DNA-binding protein [Stackebrandtia sp.]|jgi:predicted DNA-binding protein (MmcQ/YjbR family)|uniref:MmcQ/YjbR family DNA-binding protein n=1 Tax=Stackebrandtia sp. TaxID=2023065 RepID=UPI002D52838F|nr:MmcQ/YjbR family DNA-binding protein [Stackebrandtia sp.]HZE40394.1 MmcQ/YjbR family DNA-binding protein [Stackebrandtia sp.]